MRPQRLNKQDQEDLKKYRKLVAEGHKEFIPMVEWFENGKRRVYPAHKAKLMKQVARRLSSMHGSGMTYQEIAEKLQLRCNPAWLCDVNNNPERASNHRLEEIVIQGVKYEHGYL
mgnify:CR=1 FL=1|tara:strand:- start:165493 stop:165837 length:345 start_codon:yes stop_codon:yes gene_type:complete